MNTWYELKDGRLLDLLAIVQICPAQDGSFNAYRAGGENIFINTGEYEEFAKAWKLVKQNNEINPGIWHGRIQYNELGERVDE